MFTSLQTLRTHCLHFQYDVSNVPSHTEHVKRSLETSKIEKKTKICWFSGFAAITKRKNRKVPFSRRGGNIFQNPFNSIFVNLNANWFETHKSWRRLGEEKLRFLCFFGPWGHFPIFFHHGFENRLKTSVFDQNRSIVAQMIAKTMLFHVVQSASLSRFYRKHYLPSNLLENRKSWNPSVNSATVIFGAKMAVKDEILNVYKLADPQNPLSALPIWCF